MKNLKSFQVLFKEAWHFYISKIELLLAIGGVPFAIILIGYLIFSFNNKPLVLLGSTFFVIGILVYFLFFHLAMVYGLKNDDPVECYRAVSKSWWPYLKTLALVGIKVLFGLILFIIPGIIWGVQMSMVLYIFADKGLSGKLALSKSTEYVSGYWWPVFWRTSVSYLILRLGTSIAVLPFGLINNVWLQGFVAIFLTWFVIPSFSLVFNYMVYRNLIELKPELNTNPS